jgi:hypothetical protein
VADFTKLTVQVLRRDRHQCQACGIEARQVLAVHHLVPVALGGRDALSNLTTLCANCHRGVHWLATGDRSVPAHAYGLGETARARRHLLVLARGIREHRLRVVGPDRVLKTSIPLAEAIKAVVIQDGLEDAEALLFGRCLRHALRAMAAVDRKECSVRLVRNARFISVNANNHLVVRAPAYSDRGHRIEGDMLLVWPLDSRPSILSAREFRRVSASRFRLIPHFNLSLTWEECLALSTNDWKIFRRACHDALVLARTRRWTSNVVL